MLMQSLIGPTVGVLSLGVFHFQHLMFWQCDQLQAAANLCRLRVRLFRVLSIMLRSGVSECRSV